MGEVFLIEHPFLGRKFAMKVLYARFAADPRFVDRMRVEAQAAARLEHPNIVDVCDFWIAADRPCIVMELLEGATLAHELMVRGPFPVAEAVKYGCQLLAALTAAHDLGIVHRDLKPENLFLHRARHREPILKVLDFGVARVLPDASNLAPLPPVHPTTAGVVVGTPRYASPEGLRGAPVDHRADIFSSGLVLYSMLTKRGAYDHLSMNEDPLSFSIPLPSAYTVDPIPPELEQVVLKAIQWNIEERFQFASDFLYALQSIQDSLDCSAKSEAGYSTPTSTR